MCNSVLGVESGSYIIRYLQKEQMESKMTGNGFWLKKKLLPAILSLFASFASEWSWGLPCFFLGGSSRTPERSWNVVEWNPCCLLTCCHWKNYGRCSWDMLDIPSWSALPGRHDMSSQVIRIYELTVSRCWCKVNMQPPDTLWNFQSSQSPAPLRISQVRGEDIKRLLFIGVGCQVQALRSVEEDLGLDELYVLGTNLCGITPGTPRQGSQLGCQWGQRRWAFESDQIWPDIYIYI